LEKPRPFKGLQAAAVDFGLGAQGAENLFPPIYLPVLICDLSILLQKRSDRPQRFAFWQL